MEGPFLREDGGFSEMVLDAEAHTLTFTTKRGNALEIDQPDGRNVAPINGRPIVYLDQKDWSTLCLAMYDPWLVASISELELSAALRLIELSEQRKILLPFSMAHVIETCQTVEDRIRHNLAETILRLSRGWQMMHPEMIHVMDLVNSFEAEGGPGNVWSVFSLEPVAQEIQHSQWVPQQGLNVIELLVGIAKSLDGMFHRSIVWSPKLGAHEEWVEMNKVAARWLDHLGPTSPEKRRKQLALHLLYQIKDVLWRVAQAVDIPPRVFDEWRSDWAKSYRSMPALGLYCESLIQRHLNRNEWCGNDRLDMTFLTAAAVHADFVVAERQATAVINQAQKNLWCGADGIFSPKVFKSIRAALPQIEAAVSSAESCNAR